VSALYPSPFTPQARAATRVSSRWHPESLRGCGGDEAGAVLGSFRTDTRVIDMGLVDPALTGTKRAKRMARPEAPGPGRTRLALC
jgi:hypothetical protein